MAKHTSTPWKRAGREIRSGPFPSKGIIAIVPLPQNGGVFECTNNACLIISAVNACASVNPSNPLAVAEALPALVVAVSRFMEHFSNTPYSIVSPEYVDRLNTALSKAMRKDE